MVIEWLSINAWENSKNVIPVLLGESARVRTSEARRESFCEAMGKIPAKPE
jgi:hypothetical protein